MAKFDVCKGPDGDHYLLDVQSDILDILATRVVVPLIPSDQVLNAAKRLNPIFELDGVTVVMASQHIATVPRAILKTPIVNLKNEFAQISRALDMVFQGF